MMVTEIVLSEPGFIVALDINRNFFFKVFAKAIRD